MPDPQIPECDCNWFQRAAADPHIPVEYDANLNEYHLVRSGAQVGKMQMYHCPFCAGRAPASRRDELFIPISTEEQWRLRDMVRNLKTVSDVTTSLGEPDDDVADGTWIETPEATGQPGKTEYFRTLVYRRLSAMADVRVLIYPQGQVHFELASKRKTVS